MQRGFPPMKSSMLGAVLLLSLPGVVLAAGAPPSVAVMVAKATDVPVSASLSGEIAAQVDQQLSFRAGGQIADLLADVGDHVKKDQVLGHLDPHELQANADLAAASVTSAQAQVTQAQANFDRQNALFAQGTTTRANLDAAQTALDSAKGALDAAQASLAAAKETVSYAELKAASDGVVLARSAEAGQVVQAGQSVFTVAEDGRRDAVFEAYERALMGVAPDVAVKVTPLSDPNVTATGHVRQYSPALDTASGTVEIKVGLDAGSPEMALGASVTGSVALPVRHGYALPWSALFRDENGPAVWAVDTSTNTVSLKPVVIDVYLDDKVIVSSGLSDGETIARSGLQLLRPGEVIAPVAGGSP